MRQKKRKGYVTDFLMVCFAAFLTVNFCLSSGLPAAMAEEIGGGDALGDLLFEDGGEVTVSQEGMTLEEYLDEEQMAARTEEVSVLESMDPILVSSDAEQLQIHLDNLTRQESPTGSDGELICAGYIRQVMESYGYTVSEQSFHEGFLNEDGIDAPGINIIAERGADSQEYRTGEIFIISTHYDSKTKPEEGDALANDKSGVAVLLEMARILAYEETDTDICFLFLSGEEDGLYGSVNFADFLSEENRSRIRGVLHVEKVGYEPRLAYILETVAGAENEVGNLVRAEGRAETEPASDNDITVLGPDGEQNIEDLALDASDQENQEATTQPDWEYIPDEESSQKSFADVGLTAVTVCQDIYGKYREAHTELESAETGREAESGVIETADAQVSQTGAEAADREGSFGEETTEQEGFPGGDPETEQGKNSGRDLASGIELSVEGLQEITDLLAMVIARVMM